jgi:DNA-binding beta-propeller fold protein YncE
MQRSSHINAGRLALAGAIAATLGCGSGGNDSLPTSAPTSIERIADEGFTNAGAVAVSPDGETFYILAYDPMGAPTVFSLDVASKTLDALHSGAPTLYPSDVATSCDGETLFVTDMGSAPAETEIGGSDTDHGAARQGGVYSLASSGGTPTKLEATGIASASGVVVSHDCSSLIVSGFTAAGAPAVFEMGLAGGATSIIHEGAPLMNPGGIHVDAQGVAWVMDFAARGEEGEGSLFAITADGTVTSALSGVTMGRPGAVSLVPGGTTAIVPATNGEGKAFLISANTENGAKEIIDQPDLAYPTGVAAARNAPVMAIATEDAIYTATFE